MAITAIHPGEHLAEAQTPEYTRETKDQVTHTSAKETIPLQMHPRVFAALGADLIKLFLPPCLQRLIEVFFRSSSPTQFQTELNLPRRRGGCRDSPG